MVADAISTSATHPRSLLRGNAPIYLPNGWEPVDAALSWIAFGTALSRSEWDDYLFDGASDLMTRAEVLQSLEQLAAEPGSCDAFLSGAPEAGVSVNDLPPSLIDGVVNLALFLRLRSPRPTKQRVGIRSRDNQWQNRRAAKLRRWMLARRFHADPRWDGYVDTDMEALAAAEHQLLRWSADDSVPLFAWPFGETAETREITEPRLRVPRELCEAPVSFDCDGMLLPCLRSDGRQSAKPLFTGIVVPAHKLLGASPHDHLAEGQITTAPDRRRTHEKGRTRLSQSVAAAIVDLEIKLADDGVPAFGDGGQAKLERRFIDQVEARGGIISESRARVHVRETITRRVQELGKDR